eukprot:GCRY01002302.1.p1 GENE.GCRY01002302.1~~GCRY01002302.1.p1  ORF type:complete len:317 (-),score=10.79 GCRY01002302.1:450-1400(-)
MYSATAASDVTVLLSGPPPKKWDFVRNASLSTRFFLAFSVMFCLFTFGTTVERIVYIIDHHESDHESTLIVNYSVIIVLCIVFSLFFGIHSLISESKFELFSFLLFTIAISFYSSYGFFRFQNHYHSWGLYLRFFVVCSLQPLVLVSGLLASRDFGWKIYKSVGTDLIRQKAYRMVHIFQSFVAIDVMLATLLVIMVSFTLFHSYGIILNAIALCFTYLWAFAGIHAIRRENHGLLLAFHLFAFVEPAYIVLNLYSFSENPHKYRNLDLGPLIFTGVTAIFVRLTLLFYSYRSAGFFNVGLKEFFRQRSKPSSINY